MNLNLIIFFSSHLKIGVSALFGFLALFSILPLQAWFEKKFRVIRKQTVQFRDQRIRIFFSNLGKTI